MGVGVLLLHVFGRYIMLVPAVFISWFTCCSLHERFNICMICHAYYLLAFLQAFFSDEQDLRVDGPFSYWLAALKFYLSSFLAAPLLSNLPKCMTISYGQFLVITTPNRLGTLLRYNVNINFSTLMYQDTLIYSDLGHTQLCGFVKLFASKYFAFCRHAFVWQQLRVVSKYVHDLVKLY